MNDLSDTATLLQRADAGDEQALGDLLVRHRDRLLRVISFRMDRRLRGRVDAADVIQETYVEAMQRFADFCRERKMPFFVWLRLELQQRLAEVHRQHLGADKRDVRREQKIQHAHSGQTSIALAAHLVGQITSASRLVERAEMIQALEHALEEINAVDREVIALRHFEELTNIETARILGIEPAAASKRYLRALKRMREIFERVQGEMP